MLVNPSHRELFGPTSYADVASLPETPELAVIATPAAPRNIGFSLLGSLGDMADVDFGDMLDYLANDRASSAVLLYVEGITHARKFMSAAQAGVDAVYDAAFRRAGMLRVLTLAALFDAAETLALAHTPGGERLAILTNDGGVGVLASDALIDAGGALAVLSSNESRRRSRACHSALACEVHKRVSETACK